jgi:hypothetical protein
VRTASIITAMKAIRTSETSVNFNVTTLRYKPEDSKLHNFGLFEEPVIIDTQDLPFS